MKIIYGFIIFELIKFFSMLGIVFGFVEDDEKTFITWGILLILGIVLKEIVMEKNK